MSIREVVEGARQMFAAPTPQPHAPHRLCAALERILYRALADPQALGELAAEASSIPGYQPPTDDELVNAIGHVGAAAWRSVLASPNTENVRFVRAVMLGDFTLPEDHPRRCPDGMTMEAWLRRPRGPAFP